jgi:hypothetical protein
VTFNEVTAAGRIALCHLSGGAVLRYDPADRSVRTLPYPGTPRQWREGALYVEAIPRDGWSHYPHCGCPVCTSAGAPSASSPTVETGVASLDDWSTHARD